MLNLPIKILQTIQLENSTTEQVTFSNIDTLVAAWDAQKNITSRHLVLIINARSVDVSDAITNFLRINGSSAIDYMYQRVSGVNAAASAGRVDGANAINLPPICGSNNANTWGGSIVLIPYAFNTINQKTLLALGGATEFTVEAMVGRWAQIAAITSVTILEGVGDDYVAGSTFHLGVIDERYLVEEVLLAADGQPTFANIPQGEGDLAIIGYARSDRAAVTDDFLHNLNDDATVTNYWRQYLNGAGAATGAQSANNSSLGTIAGDNATANVFSPLVLTYSQYTKGNQPHYLTMAGYHESTGPTGGVEARSGRRDNIEPINKINIEPGVGVDFKNGSLFSLYRVPKRIIDRQELAAAQATITFANIPQNFEALLLHVYARTDEAAIDDEVAITINADAVAANYDFQEITGAIAAIAALRNLASQQILYVPGDNEGGEEYGGGSVLFPTYAETDRHKHFIALHGQQENRVAISSHRWENLAAITTIALSPVTGNNFLAGTVVELEGILRKEGLPPSEGEQWGV